MSIDNVQELLDEQLGKRKVDVISTETILIGAGKSYYALHFLTDTIVSAITIANDSGATESTPGALVRTYTAGTTLFLNVTAITTTSGLVIAYYEQNY